MIELGINPSLARQILTGFIRSEITRVGFTRAIIGLSGDSTLPSPVPSPQKHSARRMCWRCACPIETSSADSLEHAQLLIDQLGVQSETIEITDMVEPLIQRDPDMSRTRKGNIMARERMIILYDRSEAFKGLVVGTSNKTEILLGYSTLWGDMAAAINPIGDLYKTQVRQLSRAMNIPAPIVDKPPSADLWAGQTDEDELGFTYEDVDKLLYLLVDQRYLPEECVEAGFDTGFCGKGDCPHPPFPIQAHDAHHCQDQQPHGRL